MNWTSDSRLDSSAVSAEESLPPSSFVKEDGTDWDSHVGSIFGNHLPRKSSSIDFGLSDYPEGDVTMSQLVLPQHEDFSTNTMPFSLVRSPQQDRITLQDVFDADEPELLLHDQDDPWPSVHRSPSNAFAQAHIEEAQSSSNRCRRNVSEGLDVAENADPCYARLLWKCLREAPGFTLSLKDIYGWIRKHTQKARDPNNKGWQNSVRHNLSMNAAFERVSSSSGGEGKKGSLWRLTEHAVESGVISTTRYRRDPKRKPDRHNQPAPKRQLSGAKGGAATRAASQAKRLREAHQRFGHSTPRHYTTTPESMSATPVQGQNFEYHQSHPPSPYFIHGAMTSPAIMQNSVVPSPYSSPMMQQLAGEFPSGKSCMPPFAFTHLDYGTGLFSNVDRPYSPSMITEGGSYYTDDAGYVYSSDSMMPATH